MDSQNNEAMKARDVGWPHMMRLSAFCNMFFLLKKQVVEQSIHQKLDALSTVSVSEGPLRVQENGIVSAPLPM